MDQLLVWWENNPITHLFFSPEVMARAFPIIAKAFPVSLFLGATSFFLAIPAGLALSFMKMSRSWPLRWVSTAYIDVIRGTPLFLQILLIFFGLPIVPGYSEFVSFIGLREVSFLGVDGTIIFRGLLVLTLNSSAYMAEIFRAGIQSIGKGQSEAARSLGLTAPQTMAFVILPQTVRRILPTMMSEFILLFKDTALLAAVSVYEMTYWAKQTTATSFNQTPYIVAAFFYLIVTIPLGRFVSRLENKLAVQDSGVGGKRPPTVTGIDAEHVVPHSERVLADLRDR